MAFLRSHSGRLLILVPTGILYIALLVVDELRFFSSFSGGVIPLTAEIRFIFSALVAGLFLAVGALVWVFAVRRVFGAVLLAFCVCMMLTFAGQTASQPDLLLETLTSVGSSLAVALLFLLVCIFPKNLLHAQPGERPIQTSFRRLLFAFLICISVSCMFVMAEFVFFWQTPQLPSAINTIINIYYGVGLISILVMPLVAYRMAITERERQQERLLFGGGIVAIGPFVFLTLLPSIFGLQGIDSEYTTLSVLLLPVAIGYAMLRYQIFVFDTYIRRATAWVIGILGIVICGAIVILLARLAQEKGANGLSFIGVAAGMAILAPLVWQAAKVVSDRLFFREIQLYLRLIEDPARLANQTIDLSKATRLLMIALGEAFKTYEVACFVLDEETGFYRLNPEVEADELQRKQFVERLQVIFQGSSSSSGWVELDIDPSVREQLTKARRPRSISEIVVSENNQKPDRYLTVSERKEPLLIPVKVQQHEAQQKLIAVLALGARGDSQQYAGVDFEVIDRLLVLFSSIIETARLHEAAARFNLLLMHFYQLPMPVGETTPENVARVFVHAAAQAVRGGAEIWTYDQATEQLERQVAEGLAFQSSLASPLHPGQNDWQTWFVGGGKFVKQEDNIYPSCLPFKLGLAYCWLPLIPSQTSAPIGVLLLTYPRQHLFSQQEKQVLEMVAVQCADALENAHMTQELRNAYTHQQELDQLKDQFIATASHELRTPLTAIQGYIELLAAFSENLSSESRLDFITKANRGCDELSLMLSNIMDASHVQIDAKNVRLSGVDLAETVQHVLEILEAITRHERRNIQVNLPPGVFVMADQMRLRQVLLNLVSNALKYSPTGSQIDISAVDEDTQVAVYVRDYGKGVPLEDQPRLFERFVRLDRDINSVVRGAGLGLYISKQLIEAMGGRIWIESRGRSGDGSLFAFILTKAPLPITDISVNTWI